MWGCVQVCVGVCVCLCTYWFWHSWHAVTSSRQPVRIIKQDISEKHLKSTLSVVCSQSCSGMCSIKSVTVSKGALKRCLLRAPIDRYCLWSSYCNCFVSPSLHSQNVSCVFHFKPLFPVLTWRVAIGGVWGSSSWIWKHHIGSDLDTGSRPADSLPSAPKQLPNVCFSRLTAVEFFFISSPTVLKAGSSCMDAWPVESANWTLAEEVVGCC